MTIRTIIGGIAIAATVTLGAAACGSSASHKATEAKSATPTPLPLLTMSPLYGDTGYSGRNPAQIDFSGDSGNIVSGISWASWGPTQAVGNGIWMYQGCVPDCASGSETPYPTTIALSNPAHSRFTTITEVTSGPQGSTTTYNYGSWEPLLKVAGQVEIRTASQEQLRGHMISHPPVATLLAVSGSGVGEEAETVISPVHIWPKQNPWISIATVTEAWTGSFPQVKVVPEVVQVSVGETENPTFGCRTGFAPDTLTTAWLATLGPLLDTTALNVNSLEIPGFS
jgi:hypothetical protein